MGKSDPIDAEMAARLFQAGKAKAVPKQTDGIVESIRLLRVARHSAVKSRSAALVQVRDLIITAPQEIRDQLCCRKTLRGKVTVCARFRPSGRELRFPSQAARFALRSTAQRVQALDQEISALDRELEQLVAAAAPRTVQLLGIWTGMPVNCSSQPDRTSNDSTARARRDALRRQSDPCLVRQDKPPPTQLRRRPPSESGASPHRRLPAALLRAHPRIRQAPTAEGKTQREIMRCLKRYIAREVFTSLRADLADTAQPRPIGRDHHHVRKPGFEINRTRT